MSSIDPTTSPGLQLLRQRRAEAMAAIDRGEDPKLDGPRRDLVASAQLTSAVLAGEIDIAVAAVQDLHQAGTEQDAIIDLLVMLVKLAGVDRVAAVADRLVGRPSPPESWIDVASVDEIPDRGGIERKVNGDRVALVRYGERVHAVQALCPHQRAPMSEGFVEEDSLTCASHAWSFDLASGRCEGLPHVSIRVWPVKIDGGRVLVRS